MKNDTTEKIMTTTTKLVIEIKKRDAEFDTLSWVTLAMGQDKGRPSLCQRIYSDDGWMVGTDGHALHTVPTMLEGGVYSVLRATKTKIELVLEEDLQYLDYKQVIPEHLGAERHEFKVRELQPGTVCQIAKTVPGLFDVERMQDACSLIGGHFTVAEPTELDPFLIEYGDRAKAVLMPVRWG